MNCYCKYKELEDLTTYDIVMLPIHVVGKKNILTQDAIHLDHVKYIVKWNFDLNGETIIVPENCLIEFDGGSFSNGTLVGQETVLVYYLEEDKVLSNITLEGEFISCIQSVNCYQKQDNILIEEDGIYQVKDNKVYPVAHSDLSTQPSILPQRFGNLSIKEVLIAHGRENEIPTKAFVISAFSFNTTCCVPAIVKKVNDVWTITNSEGITPDYTLIQYVGDGHEPYYYDYDDKIDTNGFTYVDFKLPSGNIWSVGVIGGHGYIEEPSYSNYNPSSGDLLSRIPSIMGGDWEAPTAEDCQELIDNLTQFVDTNVSGFTNGDASLNFCGKFTHYALSDNKQLYFSSSSASIMDLGSSTPAMVKAVIHPKKK